MPRGERSELRGVEEGVSERDTRVSELRARLKPKALCRSRWHWSWRAATLMRYNACLPAVPLERVHVYFAGGSWMRDCSARQARPCHLLSRWMTWSHRRCLKIWSRALSRVYLRGLIPLRIPLRDPLGKQPRGSRKSSYVDSYFAHIWILEFFRVLGLLGPLVVCT